MARRKAVKTRVAPALENARQAGTDPALSGQGHVAGDWTAHMFSLY